MKKRNKSDFVVLILLGVMVMSVAMPTGAKQSQKETQTQEQKEQQLQTEDSYKEQLQQQLKELLEHMKFSLERLLQTSPSMLFQRREVLNRNLAFNS